MGQRPSRPIPLVLVLAAACQGGAEPGRALRAHGYAMLRVEPGEFLSGQAAEELASYGREPVDRVLNPNPNLVGALQPVRIDRAFLLGRTEVTQDLWQAVMGDNPSLFTACGPRCPVEQVSWCDALRFANRLSTAEGLEPAYRFPAAWAEDGSAAGCAGSASQVVWDRAADGYRLPTEIEWEWAARAGGREVYAGSDDIERVAWCVQNSGRKPQPVGLKAPNAWGFVDMSGNLLEWTWDPDGRGTNGARAVRGGSYRVVPSAVRVGWRSSYEPSYTASSLGLRLARTLP